MIFEKQEYQQHCIDNIISILKDFDFKRQNNENLKECLEKFYNSSRCKIPLRDLSPNLNIDILMETGTGKTFTYLNLIFELNKIYSQNKFIIFVPRKAILESVKQNIKLTKNYFYTQYKKYLKPYYYNDSKSLLNIISHYIKNTDELSVLILTNSSIDKDQKNLLHKQNENLFSNQSIFEEIISLKPICIIDEPHLLKGEKFYNVFKKFQNLYFRFGATFPKEESHKLSNLAYCLDSISAFNTFLVKQIYVHTLCGQNQAPSLIRIDSRDKKATFSYFLDNIEYKKDIFYGQDLGANLYYPKFNGIELIKVNTKDGAILSNQTNIPLSKDSYRLDEIQTAELIALSIDLHFKKEQSLFEKGIKALSLFFIPDIESFRGQNPFIKNEFERIYKLKRAEILKLDIPKAYREYLAKDFDSSGDLCVHQGYFSGDGKSKEEKEAEGVKLILEQKEKLLYLDTPLRFIFSVWALQEGWDNPNIFTITKLASSSSEISRHQQIGRGLRLCVNDEGKRITCDYLGGDSNVFYDINYLDVVVSGEEKGFIEGLQKEIEESSFSFNQKALDFDMLKSYGLNQMQANKIINMLEEANVIVYDEKSDNFKIINPIYELMNENSKIKDILGDKFDSILEIFRPSNNKHLQTNNANKQKSKVSIKKNLAQEFKELWEYINAKTKIVYQDIQTERLIEEIVNAFNQEEIPQDYIFIQSKHYDTFNNKITIKEEKILPQKDINNNTFIAQNILEFSKEQNLSLDFVMKVYNALNHRHFSKNPKFAFGVLKNIIKEQIHKNIIQSVSYDFEPILNISNQDLLFYPNGKPKEEIEVQKLGHFVDEDSIPQAHYLYEKCVYDSDIEKEAMVNDPMNINDKTIKVFAKLPKFSIPTPYKNYEPDFAYLIEDKNGSKIFFVCETKGYDSIRGISDDEVKKIDYAKRFFEGLDRRLPNIKVIFQTRINKQKLIDVLKSTLQEDSNDR
ncbi:DEAD/DEAH box helicase family protein [Helicobacter sp. 13S00477-4]|uniref:restriction endonuclease n=1 Tax=Helicobacter sp. 13S00477-4 TaxID=1905759 RepID=UPI000BA55924|nr:DEAD/DEAH box helicase family protein [Helicobacter sp. 13S00477-4]PAF52517.1 DEAD/DEAH box helicase [Helicobacter sp. 13S00477-4]